MIDNFIVTCDTDWVPRYMLEEVIKKLAIYQVKATFFCTDIFDFTPSEFVETAVHPNLMPDTTQGDSVDAILHSLREQTHAIGVRTHRMFWYGDLAATLKKHQFLYDSSLFLPLQSHLTANNHDTIVRIPVWWGDNLHLRQKFDITAPQGIPNFKKPGLKVLDFHPINIYFNTPSTYEQSIIYRRFKKNPKMSQEEADALVHQGHGIGSLFERFLEHIAINQTCSSFLRDLIKR